MPEPTIPPAGDGLPDLDAVDVEVSLGGRMDVRTPVWYAARLFVGFLRVLRAALHDAGPRTRRALFDLAVVLFHTRGRGAQRFGVDPASVDLSVLVPEDRGPARECRVVVIGRPVAERAKRPRRDAARSPWAYRRLYRSANMEPVSIAAAQRAERRRN